MHQEAQSNPIFLSSGRGIFRRASRSPSPSVLPVRVLTLPPQTMKEAWAKGRKVYVHGWLFDVKSGLLNDLGVSQGPQ